MAKVFDNPITEGLSGRLGRSRLQFRKGRKGKTIVALSPVFSENRVFNETQLAQQEAFRQAAQYAVGARDNPVYVNLARGAEATAYNLAIADWFGKPEVLQIDASGWTGQVGQTIRILAKDDTYVTGVHVTITDAQEAVLEEGEAVRAAGPARPEGWWIYTATSDLSTNPDRQITAVATDLPGNTGSLAE